MMQQFCDTLGPFEGIVVELDEKYLDGKPRFIKVTTNLFIVETPLNA